MRQAVTVEPGDSPIILAAPHPGTDLPEAVLARLNPLGQSLADADWHVDTLYRGLLPGATRVRANFHRYLIDANRDPAGGSLYPGQNTTTLVPLSDFDGRPIWRDGQAPDAAEIDERTARYHAVYHAALAEQIARLRDLHPQVLIYDCHSIRSEIPYLFSGRLPVFNLGSNDGASCDPELAAAAAEVCAGAAADGYDSVSNGRFKGGWTTRHYGRPADGVHALQMELAQRAYLAAETAPFRYDEKRAGRLRPYLGVILRRLEAMLKARAAD